VLWSRLVSRVGTSHRVNLSALHCICHKVLPAKDVPIIFTDFCFISRNHRLACSRLLEGYKVPGPKYSLSLWGLLLLHSTLKRKFLKRITLTDAIMAEMPTSDCAEKFLECC